MEKIKQALERARNEQNDASTDTAVETPLADEEGRVDHRIKYEQTRVIPIDPEILRANRIVVGSNIHAPSETAFKILRTQIEQRLSSKNWNAIGITSPAPGVGKTLTAVNLSLALAQEVHRTVLLVDLDFRKPGIHECFGYSVEKGLVDYLLDDEPLHKILLNPGVERLVLLPVGNQSVANSSELLSSPKMIRLVDELKSRYPSRIVIFDLPPALVSDDTLAFAPYIDSTLLVLQDGKTTKEELRRVLEIMGDIDVIGTVLNKATEQQNTYYTT